MPETPFHPIGNAGLVWCERCGAVVYDAPGLRERHIAWHDSIDRRINDAAQVGSYADMVTRPLGSAAS